VRARVWAGCVVVAGLAAGACRGGGGGAAPLPPDAAVPAALPPVDAATPAPVVDLCAAMPASAPDQPPEVLAGTSAKKFGTHYYISDEEHPDRFRDHVADLGGGYVGIGSDQAYLYIGWARPRFAWTVDYDPEIVRMHRLHQAFIARSETPAAYRKLWSSARRDEASAIVDDITPDDAERKELRRVLRKAAARVEYRLRKLVKLPDVKTFLNDQDTYDFVRGLIRNGCVRPMLVDLLQTDGLRGIADAATSVGLPIRALYLSNAEEYWDYTDEFRANVRALPRDDRSVVLHTQASRTNDDYRYTVQGLDNFVAWLDDGSTRDIDAMLGRPPIAGPTDFPIRRFDKTPDARRKR
jgi:hypothetical protein